MSSPSEEDIRAAQEIYEGVCQEDWRSRDILPELSRIRAEGRREGIEAAIAAIPRTLYIAGSGKAGIEVRAAVESAIRRAMEAGHATE